MDTQIEQRTSDNDLTTATNSSGVFAPGSTVIYGFHGKCKLLTVEERKVGERQVPFFKIEVLKSSFSRSSKQEPAIWVPVDSAKQQGLRLPMNSTQAGEAMAILGNHEYYFSAQEPWGMVRTKLEECVRTEGYLGLAKVASYLHVLKRKQIVPHSVVTKFSESIDRILFRELSEATNQPLRAIEDLVAKALRQKTIQNH